MTSIFVNAFHIKKLLETTNRSPWVVGNRVGGMAKKRRQSSIKRSAGLTRLADVLPQLIARYGIQQRSKIEEIDAAWKETVGEPYASVTRVTGLNRGQLEIAVPHNAFIQELSFRQAELLHSLQTAATGMKITKLKFVVIDLTR